MDINKSKKIFWQSIDLIAEKKGVSVYGLAKLTGITPVVLRQKDKMPNMSTIIRILEWADMSLKEWADIIIYLSDKED